MSGIGRVSGVGARRTLPPLLNDYGVAAALVVAAVALMLVMDFALAGRPSLFPFFAAVACAAWLRGTGPGLFAALLSAPANFYFFLSAPRAPTWTLNVELSLVFLVASAAAGSILHARQQKIDERLKRTHRQLEIKAAELQRTNEALIAEMNEHRRTEETLERTRSELTHVARLTTMGELAASIAHEINQPLAAAVTNAESCVRWLDAGDADEARQAAKRIACDTHRAGEVIKRLRAMFRKALSERAYVDLAATIGDVVSLLRHEMERRGVVLRTEFEDALPPVWGDRIQLQQVFLNLMMNALDAMSTVTGRPRRILLRCRQEDSGVAVFVEDTGEGFAEGTLEKLFDAFITTKTNGMGIGLSICRTIVEAHGGTLTASPGDPHGAVFQVTLPLKGNQT